MACEYCKGKTCLNSGSIELSIVDGELHVESSMSDPWYNASEDFEINNCPMCGKRLGDTNE